jgi:hypothetical protein
MAHARPLVPRVTVWATGKPRPCGLPAHIHRYHRDLLAEGELARCPRTAHSLRGRVGISPSFACRRLSDMTRPTSPATIRQRVVFVQRIQRPSSKGGTRIRSCRYRPQRTGPYSCRCSPGTTSCLPPAKSPASPHPAARSTHRGAPPNRVIDPVRPGVFISGAPAPTIGAG